MPAERQTLRKTLTVSHAIGLALTIVVGGGLLVLPGLAYKQAGGAAIYIWLLDLVLVVPLLIIFARLGAKWPSAGGIAGFLQNAFSRRFAAATEILLIGTFGLGIPAIALVGGQYCAVLVGTNAAALPAAFVLLAIACAVNCRGAGISGNISESAGVCPMRGVVFSAVAALIFGDWNRGENIAPLSSVQTWRAVVPAAGLVFFAFTGWEMLSFTAEEYRNPRRDFPLAVGASFVIVAVLYLLVAFAVQTTLGRDDPQTETAPVAALLSGITDNGGVIAAIAAVVILLANVIGATWAASRLVFSSAREGLLPAFVAAVDARQTPRIAVLICSISFAAVLGVYAADWISLDGMLRLAGQNFFLLYALSVAAYIRTEKTLAARILGIASLAVATIMMGVFGVEMLYPAALLLAGWVAHGVALRNKRN